MNLRNIVSLPTQARIKIFIIFALLIIVGIFIISFFLKGIYIIETGNVGVRTTMGTIDKDELKPGINFAIPYFQKIEPVFAKTTLLNYSTSEDNKKDTEEIVYESSIQGEDKSGLPISFDISVEVSPVEDLVADMFIEIGRQGFEKKVIHTIRAVGRRVISQYDADTIMSKRKDVENELDLNLRNSIHETKFYKFEKSQLKTISLPDNVKNGIELVALAKQDALAKEQQIKANQNLAQSEIELAKGKAQAEIERANGSSQARRIEAESISDSNKKVAESLGDKILIKMWIEAWEKGGANVPNAITGGNSPFLLNMSIPEIKKN